MIRRTPPGAERLRDGVGSSFKSGDLLERLALPFAWAALIVVFGIMRPSSFLTWSNFGSMFGSQAVLVVLTLALLLVLRTGDYDLSTASVLTMSSMLVGVLNVQHGIPIVLAVLAALGTGLDS